MTNPTREEVERILGAVGRESTCGRALAHYQVLLKDREAVRPEVRDFAVAMESVLKDNDHKRGWDAMYPDELWLKFTEEVKEVQDEIEKFQRFDCSADDLEGGNIQQLIQELVDVANVCMFFRYNLLRSQRGD